MSTQYLDYLYGISLRMFLVSAADTKVDRRNFLFRFSFARKQVTLEALIPFDLAAGRYLNLLAAALLVLILGTDSL
jgi:hypothetical protein